MSRLFAIKAGENHMYSEKDKSILRFLAEQYVGICESGRNKELREIW